MQILSKQEQRAIEGGTIDWPEYMKKIITTQTPPTFPEEPGSGNEPYPGSGPNGGI